MTAAPFPDPPGSDLPSGEPSRSDQPSWQPAPPAPAAGVPHRRLLRSTTNRVLGGVCGGLAEYTGTDPLLWRVGFIALAVMGAGIWSTRCCGCSCRPPARKTPPPPVSMQRSEMDVPPAGKD